MRITVSPQMRLYIVTFLIAAVASGGALTIVLSGGSDRSAPTAVQATGEARIEVEHALEPTDTERMVGFADNVFAGQVVAQVGAEPLQASGPLTEPTSTIPQTQFAVRVLRNIKGTLSGTVIVNQQGGIAPDGSLQLIEGDNLLESGRRYMLLTRRNATQGWNTIIAPVRAKIPYDTDEELERLTVTYEAAHANEIPFSEGIE